MKTVCIDEGTLQMFLDGESPAELTDSITAHIDGCDVCAMRLAEAEEQTALVFAALDRDLNTLVPTHRLWDRISESIETERAKTPFWERAYAFLSLQLLSPSLTAAAGVLMIAVIAGTVFFMGSQGNSDIAALNVNEPQAAPQLPVEPAREVPRTAVVTNVPDTEVALERPAASDTRRPVPQNARYAPAASRRVTASEEPQAMTLQYVPGEESYIRTIDELNASVEMQKDRVLPPSSRIAFERDLAVVNDAIGRMQQVVRRNPRDQAAKQVLYAAYQNKIDLLNSVGQREELMASLR
jgi:anti-sigma factor RsiW